MAKIWSPVYVPTSRYEKPDWYKSRMKQARVAFDTPCETALIGDSIVRGLTRYHGIWNSFFTNAINLGIGGDMTQHVLWRVRNLRFSPSIKFIVVHCGTNILDQHHPYDISIISYGIISIGNEIHKVNPNIVVILSGILPRESSTTKNNKIKITNNLLMEGCNHKNNLLYLEHGSDWSVDEKIVEIISI